MAPLSTWTELSVTVFLVTVALSSIPEAFGASYRLQHQGLLPVGRRVRESLHPSIKSNSQEKKKKSKSLRVPNSKKSAIDNLNRIVFPEEEEELPMYKSELKGNEILAAPPASASNYEDEDDDKAKIVSYYDCPLFTNTNEDGSAIIKADPFDCSCYYYCDYYGRSSISCCMWPLLWNDEIKSCDWYWKATCVTYDGWDE